MSDRLEQLRRQRELLQQHLAWLDAEIATATKTDPLAPESHAAPSSAAPVSLRTDPVDADLAQFIAAQKDAPFDSASEAKRGCIVAFALMLAVLGIAVFAWYLLFRARH